MGKRSLKERIELEIKFAKLLLASFLVFGGGVAGIAAYADFLEQRIGAFAADTLLFIVIGAMGVVGLMFFVKLAIIQTLNAKEKD
jgi:hypothetical protein